MKQPRPGLHIPRHFDKFLAQFEPEGSEPLDTFKRAVVFSAYEAVISSLEDAVNACQSMPYRTKQSKTELAELKRRLGNKAFEKEIVRPGRSLIQMYRISQSTLNRIEHRIGTSQMLQICARIGGKSSFMDLFPLPGQE